MLRQKQRPVVFIRNNKGFSLIEMAVVLIIIGIIIGAIVKGKDIMRSGEQKKIYTKFVNAWNLSYLGFYDRTGKVLGDTWNTDNATEYAGQDGEADTAGGVTGDVSDVGRAALATGGTGFMGLSDAGLNAPTTNTSLNYTYRYTDSGGTGHILSVAFEYSDADDYNYMWVINCPNELGLALDTMVDGEADGTAGDFLCFLLDDSGSAIAWDATGPTDDVSFRWKMQF